MPARAFPVQGLFSAAGKATTNAYADLADAFWVANYRAVNLIVANGDSTNGAKVKVLGSVDNGENWDVEVQAEATVAASATLQVKCADPYTHLKVQIKSAVADTPATVLCRGFGTSA